MIGQVLECLDEIIGISSDLEQPAAAGKAIDLLRRLRGLIQGEQRESGSCHPAAGPLRDAAAGVAAA